jgi:hypothetical protein
MHDRNTVVLGEMERLPFKSTVCAFQHESAQIAIPLRSSFREAHHFSLDVNRFSEQEIETLSREDNDENCWLLIPGFMPQEPKFGFSAWRETPGVKLRSTAYFSSLSLSKSRSTNETLRSLKALLEVNSAFRQGSKICFADA